MRLAMEGPPASILIIGSGAFGLSTAWALTRRRFFADTVITVVDQGGGQFPPRDSASVDSSRIVRADYADPDYTALATAAQAEWRKQGDDELGGQGRYTESGLLLTADKFGGANDPSLQYVERSRQNVLEYADSYGFPADRVLTLENKEAVNQYLGTHGYAGDLGYVNLLSGWADSGKSMRWLYERVEATQRVDFLDARVRQLETEGDRVVGARLSDGVTIRADVVLVAAGAWSGELVDLRGRVEATGHVLAYLDITDDEQAALSRQPVVLHLSSGLFAVPPRDNVLKVAQHGCGYHNPQVVSSALPLHPGIKREPIVVSRPVTLRNGYDGRLPRQAEASMRRALRQLVPVEGLQDRPWRETRLCWYADTEDADWLVDWHPGWKGLFLATGDSGHAFKFLPVLGDQVVACLLGQGGRLGHKWRWKEVGQAEAGRETDGKYTCFVTKDGSRGISPAAIWQDALSRTGHNL